MIRAALILRHGIVPRAVHFNTPNPNIPWEKIPFDVPRKNTPLRADRHSDAPIVVSVNSFGFGGSNGHLVMESLPPSFSEDHDLGLLQADDTDPSVHVPLLLPISARSEASLRELATRYEELLVSLGSDASYTRLAQLCLETSLKRAHHGGFRLAAVGRTCTQLVDSIKSQLSTSRLGPLTAGSTQAPEVAFLFTGQGSQYAGMGHQLYQRNAIFHAHIDEVDRLMAPHLGGISILQSVIQGSDDTLAARTLYSQTAIFAIEYALARVWASMGIVPDVVMGHSVGEVVAAVVAGCLSLADGVALICARAKAIDSLPPGQGGLTVVFDTLENVEALAATCEPAGRLEIAANNGVAPVNVAGSIEALVDLEAKLKAKATRYKRLDVSHAFHSSAMDAALPAFTDAISNLTFKAPRCKFIALAAGEELAGVPGVEHWVSNLRQPVLFLQGMRTLVPDHRSRVLIEIGADSALLAMAKNIVDKEAPVAMIPTLTRRKRDDENLKFVEALGQAYNANVSINFKVRADAVERPVKRPSFHSFLYVWEEQAVLLCNLREGD